MFHCSCANDISAKPQLTRLVDEAPTGHGWLHEIKYDSYRMPARIDGQEAAHPYG